MIPIIGNKNGFLVARIHYSLDPLKNTKEWIERTKKGMTQRGWEREYEISYEAFAGQSVYPEFSNNCIQNISYKPNELVLRGWDFGYHHPAVVFCKINEFDQLCQLKELIGEDEMIEVFTKKVIEFGQVNFPNTQYWDACDPSGHQKSDKDEKTSIQVLNSLGIYPISKPAPISEGLEMIRKRLLLRDDGKYGFVIDPSCIHTIDAFKGGYRYPEVKEGQSEKEEPLKDGFYEHLMDALRYLVINKFTLPPPLRREYKKKEYKPLFPVTRY